MPFYKKIEKNDVVIGLWRITETVYQLKSLCQLNDYDQQRFCRFNNNKRKKEFLAVRALLQQLIGNDEAIIYNENGKPSLSKSPLHISISHNSEFAVVALAQENIGIDIELKSREMFKIKKKYLSHNEINSVDYSDDAHLTGLMLWLAKEAIYKYLDRKGIVFNQQIEIEPINSQVECFTGVFLQDDLQQRFQLFKIEIDNSILVYSKGVIYSSPKT